MRWRRVKLEEHFPEGRKALEGGEEFKEVNHTPVNPLFTLLFSPEVSSQLFTTPIMSDAICNRNGPTRHPSRLFHATESSGWVIRLVLKGPYQWINFTPVSHVGIRRLITKNKQQWKSALLSFLLYQHATCRTD